MLDLVKSPLFAQIAFSVKYFIYCIKNFRGVVIAVLFLLFFSRDAIAILAFSPFVRSILTIRILLFFNSIEFIGNVFF